MSEAEENESQTRPDAPGEGRVVMVRGSQTDLSQEIIIGPHRIAADEPVPPGTDTGPTPYQLLSAALGACTSITLSMYARQKEWPLESVTVVLTHGKIHASDCAECETTEGKVDRIERAIELGGPLSDEQRRRLMEIAEKCPVHRTLRSEIDVQTRLVGSD